MQLKNQTYKVKGMRKDDSYSSFNPEYSWNNKNIRLTARDGNDLLSITNERGNLSIGINEYYRDPIGTKYTYTPLFSNYVIVSAPATYTYTPSFNGYINVAVPPVYTYSAGFTNYANVVIPPTYTYTPLFSNYTNTLTAI